MHKLYDQLMVGVGRVLTLSREDLKREDGQGATEYGILIAFVVLTLTLTVGGLGSAISAFLGRVAASVGSLAS